MSRGKHFTEKEIEYLKVNSLVMSTKELADNLGRNYWAVHRKLQALGISKNHIFTPDEDYIIKRMYGKFTAKAIATKGAWKRKGGGGSLSLIGLTSAPQCLIL